MLFSLIIFFVLGHEASSTLTSFTGAANSDLKVKSLPQVNSPQGFQEHKSSEDLRSLVSLLNQKILILESRISGLASETAKISNSQQQFILAVEKRFELINQKLNLTSNDSESLSVSTVQTQVEYAETKGNKTIDHAFPVEVVELTEDSGVIEFNQEAQPNLIRKIWILRKEADLRDIKFTLEENKLELSTLAIYDRSFLEYVYNGTQEDWNEEKVFSGLFYFVILTLKKLQSGSQPVAFKLRYNFTIEPSQYEHSSKVLTENGLQVLSFPYQNVQHFPPNTKFFGLIAPRNGKPFKLTLKYLDVPGEQPDCPNAWLWIYFLTEKKTGATFEIKKIRGSDSGCGRLGNVSDIIGHSALALVRFLSYTDSTKTGKGFKLEIESVSS